ncbi:MAG TPA: dienelactone hydrolase family protein [Actinomycetota bacterium]|nr:dienelactone hydrolase family protein [Actinomycetota bacterium]
MRRTTLLAEAVLVGVVLLAAACGAEEGQDGGSEVNSEVLSPEGTQGMLVFGPDAEGPWPVVFAMHGIDGQAEDMTELATRLAREGVVVFAPTYRTDVTTEEAREQAGMDLECAYRFARSVAAEYGGDLDRPVTIVGWSLGATGALALGLSEDIDPSGDLGCFSPAPRPDVVVAISGCHYEWEGRPSDLIDVSELGNDAADVVLVAGEEDATCAAWQTEDMAAELRSAGYDLDLILLEGADHLAPVFHDVVDGEWVVDPNDPAGERTVGLILNAIAAARAAP